jgi:hypothetical protein
VNAAWSIGAVRIARIFRHAGVSAGAGASGTGAGGGTDERPARCRRGRQVEERAVFCASAAHHVGLQLQELAITD